MTRRLNDCETCEGKTRHANGVCSRCRETAAILADPAAMAAVQEALAEHDDVVRVTEL